MTLSFSEEEISATVQEVSGSERAREQTLNARERVVAALQDGPAYLEELAEVTGLAKGTVKNAVTKLKATDPPTVRSTGIVNHQGAEQVELVGERGRPVGGGTGTTTNRDGASATSRYNRMVEERMAELEGRDEGRMF